MEDSLGSGFGIVLCLEGGKKGVHCESISKSAILLIGD